MAKFTRNNKNRPKRPNSKRALGQRLRRQKEKEEKYACRLLEAEEKSAQQLFGTESITVSPSMAKGTYNKSRRIKRPSTKKAIGQRLRRKKEKEEKEHARLILESEKITVIPSPSSLKKEPVNTPSFPIKSKQNSADSSSCSPKKGSIDLPSFPMISKQNSADSSPIDLPSFPMISKQNSADSSPIDLPSFPMISKQNSADSSQNSLKKGPVNTPSFPMIPKQNSADSSAENLVSQENDCINIEKIKLTDEQRLQLEEQIRMFVQITTQLFLFSLKNPRLDFISVSSKHILEEIKSVALSGASAFNAVNLDEALAIVDKFEKNKEKLKGPKKPQSETSVGLPGMQIRKALFHSKVFMYPELLPKRGLSVWIPSRATFTFAEDNLIALGLEKFPNEVSRLRDISANLLPCKTPEQIRMRIKNAKAKCPPNHPINYYLKHKKAPEITRFVREFNPKNIKAPKDQHLQVLPPWAKSLKIVLYPQCAKTDRLIDKKTKIVQRTILPNGPIQYSVIASNFSEPIVMNSTPKKVICEPPKPLKPRLILPKPVSTSVKMALNSPLLANTNKENGPNCSPNLIDNTSNCNLIYVMNNKSGNVDSCTNINKSKLEFFSGEEKIIFKSEVAYEMEESMDVFCTENSMDNSVTKSSQFCVNTKDDDFSIKSETMYESEESIDDTEDVSDTENLIDSSVTRSSKFSVNSKVDGISNGCSVTDISSDIGGIKIKSEVIDETEESTENITMIDQNIEKIQNSVIKSNSLQSAHYQNFKRSKIKKCKNNVTSRNCSKFDQNFDENQLNISIKQEIIDNNADFENLSHATCSNFVSNDSANECNISKKSKVTDGSAIKFTQDVCSLPCLLKNSAEAKTIENNALQDEHYKTSKRKELDNEKALNKSNAKIVHCTKSIEDKHNPTKSKTKSTEIVKSNAIQEVNNKISDKGMQKKRKASSELAKIKDVSVEKSTQDIFDIGCNSKNSFTITKLNNNIALQIVEHKRIKKS